MLLQLRRGGVVRVQVAAAQHHKDTVIGSKCTLQTQHTRKHSLMHATCIAQTCNMTTVLQLLPKPLPSQIYQKGLIHQRACVRAIISPPPALACHHPCTRLPMPSQKLLTPSQQASTFASAAHSLAALHSNSDAACALSSLCIAFACCEHACFDYSIHPIPSPSRRCIPSVKSTVAA